MIESTMTKATKGRILTMITRKINDKSIYGFYPKMMAEQKKILCFLDFDEIPIGMEYTSIKGHGLSSKYFHRDCYNRMHY